METLKRKENLHFEGRPLRCVLLEGVVVKKTFSASVCLGEKVWKKSGACDYWTRAGQGPRRPGQTAAEKRIFTLNSTRLVSGAGSGIVAGPDRVRRGQEGETEGGGFGAGTGGCPRGHGVLTPPGAGGGMEGQILADFRCVQMLNMQMSNRIVRR